MNDLENRLKELQETVHEELRFNAIMRDRSIEFGEDDSIYKMYKHKYDTIEQVKITMQRLNLWKD